MVHNHQIECVQAVVGLPKDARDNESKNRFRSSKIAAMRSVRLCSSTTDWCRKAVPELTLGAAFYFHPNRVAMPESTCVGWGANEWSGRGQPSHLIRSRCPLIGLTEHWKQDCENSPWVDLANHCPRLQKLCTTTACLGMRQHKRCSFKGKGAVLSRRQRHGFGPTAIRLT